MRQTDQATMYRRIYRILQNCTPLRKDCGVVCGSACCKGDGRTGMRLFPGEQSTLPIKEGEGGRFVVCDGTCDRKQRPLSCRIFPFFPVLNEDGSIEVRIDPRGRNVCPLVRQAEHVAFDPRFLKRLEKVGQLLSEDEACRRFLTEISEEILETEQVLEIITDRS